MKFAPTIETAKDIGKWIITLTAPLWIFPALILAIPFLFFGLVHHCLWGPRRQRHPLHGIQKGH